jgi:hypothetical protein
MGNLYVALNMQDLISIKTYTAWCIMNCNMLNVEQANPFSNKVVREEVGGDKSETSKLDVDI